MAIYLGLGSNLGGRSANLRAAIAALSDAGFHLSRAAPIIESPALLPDDADPDWLRPYLNTVIEGDTALTPDALLIAIKRIETSLGRDLAAPRWSPRPIDIDIIFWEGEQRISSSLTLPHPHAHRRAFVLTPLCALRPDLVIEGQTVMQLSRSTPPLPQWMGILNATPDSFSDGGTLLEGDTLVERLSKWFDAGVQWCDVGAESTRPNGRAISTQEEWQRLSPVIAAFQAHKKTMTEHWIAPRLSIDTRNPETAARAIDAGADAINDVSGLQDVNMQAVIRESGITAIAMHSLSVPVIPGETLSSQESVVTQLTRWVETRAEQWQRAGLDLSRIIIDPGIGFGKNALQNIELLQHCAELRKTGFRLLIGHSRKSFMNGFSATPFSDRDLETLGISIGLAAQGVDIIRVHEPLSHLRVHRAWAHLQAHKP